jgi:hypothetical protein
MPPSSNSTAKNSPAPKLPAPKIPHVYVEKGLWNGKVQKG